MVKIEDENDLKGKVIWNKHNRVSDFVKSLTKDELEELNLLLIQKNHLGIPDQLIGLNPMSISGGVANDISCDNYLKALKMQRVNEPVYPSYQYERLKKTIDRRDFEYLKSSDDMVAHEIEWDWLTKYGCSFNSTINENHPEWNKVYNVLRRTQYLPSIELVLNGIYMITIRNRVLRFKLVRIEKANSNFPELYFIEDNIFKPKKKKYPQNISVMYILNKGKERKK